MEGGATATSACDFKPAAANHLYTPQGRRAALRISHNIWNFNSEYCDMSFEQNTNCQVMYSAIDALKHYIIAHIPSAHGMFLAVSLFVIRTTCIAAQCS